jgi:quercetin dioxygenase-like cupin family protein
MNNIDKVKELTDNLPAVPKLTDLVKLDDCSPHSVIYDVQKGTSFGFNLLNRPEVSVMELFVSKGTCWPKHVHNESTEWGIIYKGKLKVTLCNKVKTLGKGDWILFEKGVAHSSVALEDTWLIALAIPKIDGYPK